MKKLFTFRFAIIITLIMNLALVGCKEIDENIEVETVTQTEAPELPYPVEIGAFVFKNAPETLVSLSPALTEIICELGFSDVLIGRSSYCTYPESISEINTMGSSANPDVAAISQAAPALLISQSPIAKKDIVTIEAAGTRVMIMPSPSSVDELYSNYVSISAIFSGKLNADSDGKKATLPLKNALSEAENSIGSYVYILDSYLSVANDTTFIGDFMSHFGQNAVSDDAISLSSDELRELNPEYVFIASPVSYTKFCEKFDELDAVKNDHVIVIDKDIQERLERPTSRLSETVYKILDEIK